MAETAICPHCGAAGDASQQFCGTCGGSMARPCPSCGRPVPPGFRFCGSCGAALGEAAAPATYEGERRWATVLFADLSGFTRLSETLDPEDVTEVIGRCMDLMSEVIERFGGRVARVIGDELMAVFGAPLAYEDDPERAVRAAIGLQTLARERSREFGGMPLRIGVNTGEMMFGPVGPDREPTVMGDAVNTAKRLQTAVDPGNVIVGEQTYRSSRHAITFEQLAPFEAKGKAEPLSAWRALDVVAEPAHRPVSASPIVGRGSELDLLHRIWSRVDSERRLHLATVIGPPGIGKTRISREFITALEQAGVRILRGRSLPYGESTGYGAFAQQLKSLAGIMETDAAPAAAQKLTDTLGSALRDEESTAVIGTIPVLAGLESAGPGPEQTVVFHAARRVVEALGRELPTILLFEDIHWADTTLLDLIEALAARARETRVMLLTLARPELLERRPNWAGGLQSYTVLPLQPLTEDDAGVLVRNLLPDMEASGLIERLVETAGGNPLFLEELAAAVSERTAGIVRELPTSVSGIIAARLDLLPPAQRRVLMDASVIGKVFWRGALERMGSVEQLDEALDTLEIKDFIRRESASRMQGDVEFVFKHMLIREVAYQTLPKAARRERHTAVAKFVEEATGDRIGESASLLAHHWREAGETERAIEYLMMAADHASKVWAKHEAIALLSDALEMIPASDEGRRRDLMLRRGRERVDIGDFEGTFGDLKPILNELTGRDLIEALIALSHASFWLFGVQEGAEYARRAVDLAQGANDDLVAPATAALSWNLSAIEGGRKLREAREAGLVALAGWREGVHEGLFAQHLAHTALFSYWLGEYATGLPYVERGYALASSRQALAGMAEGGANHGLILAGLGRQEEAIATFEQTIAQAREVGTAARWVARAGNMLAGALRDAYDLDDARRRNEEAIETARSVNFALAEAQGGLDLALLELLLGEVGAAQARLPELTELAERARGFHQWLIAGRLADFRARVALGAGDLDAALAHASDSLARAEIANRTKYQALSMETIGRALVGVGKIDDARAQLKTAAEVADRLGTPTVVWRAHAALAEASAAAGDDAAASVAAERAKSAVESFAAGLSDARRGRFLAFPAVQDVLSLGR